MAKKRKTKKKAQSRFISVTVRKNPINILSRKKAGIRNTKPKLLGSHRKPLKRGSSQTHRLYLIQELYNGKWHTIVGIHKPDTMAAKTLAFKYAKDWKKNYPNKTVRVVTP